MAITSAFYVLRYTHVTLIPLIMLFAYSFYFIADYIWRKQQSKRTFFAVVTTIFCCWFISANYYNFIYQYTAQYYNRGIESRMLKKLNLLLTDDNAVLNVIGIGEPYTYFLRRGRDVLPLYGYDPITNIRNNTISYWNPGVMNYFTIDKSRYLSGQMAEALANSGLHIYESRQRTFGYPKKLLDFSKGFADFWGNDLLFRDAGVHDFYNYRFDLYQVNDFTKIYSKRITDGDTVTEDLSEMKSGEAYMLEILNLSGDNSSILISLPEVNMQFHYYSSMRNIAADNGLNTPFVNIADSEITVNINISDVIGSFEVNIWELSKAD